MKGYRCDNCRDFAEEVLIEDRRSFEPHARKPDDWIASWSEYGGPVLHFCCENCLIAFYERESAEVAE